MIPAFLLGVFVFVSILLMFQALRLTEFILVFGVKVSTVLEMMGYLSMSFLPILFPMSLIFTVILIYGRLSSDSEIVALRAAGLSMVSIGAPALILSFLVSILSLQTSFHLAPWGHQKFDALINQLGSAKPGVTIKEGTFSDGFFDLVVYANKVDNKQGTLHDVFIYDERTQPPIAIVAREGRIVKDDEKPGQSAALQLTDGSFHRATEARHTKIDFRTYDLHLFAPVNQSSISSKATIALTLDELRQALRGEAGELKPEKRIDLETEFHKRIAIGLACFILGVIGVALGTVTNRRNVKAGGAVLSIGIIVTYWILFLASESLARGGILVPWLAMWLTNIIFAVAGGFLLRRAWNS
jgi:lipopolysaccharide export system permease protein